MRSAVCKIPLYKRTHTYVSLDDSVSPILYHTDGPFTLSIYTENSDSLKKLPGGKLLR